MLRTLRVRGTWNKAGELPARGNNTQKRELNLARQWLTPLVIVLLLTGSPVGFVSPVAAKEHKGKKLRSPSKEDVGSAQKPATDGTGENNTQGAANAAAAAAGTAVAVPATAASSAAQGVSSTEQASTKKPIAGNIWSEQEITEAKARCTAILKRIHAVAIPQEPIKEGLCGTPAPIQLISIGQNPEVSLSPPAIVTCDLAEGLVTWLENDLQPLAKKHFKSRIIAIQTMSSYSCRNAYGRKSTRLSEHGLANALDIGGFVTETAKSAQVLEGWGTTEREEKARIAAEKAAAEREAAERLAAEKAAAEAAAQRSAQEQKGDQAAAPSVVARSTILEGVPEITLSVPGSETSVTASLAAKVPDRLGGPGSLSDRALSRLAKLRPTKVLAIEALPPPEKTVQAFLHDAHASACRLFGTTLGPEANADHRNHFHVDMAPRAIKKICD